MLHNSDIMNRSELGLDQETEINYYMESLGRNISGLTVTSVFYKSSLTPLLRLNKEVTYCPDHLLRFHPRNAPSSSPDTGGNS